MSDAPHDPVFARAMAPVARELLGEPNEALSSKEELQFGTRGSMCIKLRAGTWYDHESDIGGGVIAFVQQQRSVDEEAAIEWLRGRGHLPKSSGKFNIVARYPYTDIDGKLIFEVIRLEPKNFRQRRPDGAGGWIWKMTGVHRVIYRLPEVMAAAQAGSLVYITEGEKSADALAGLGLCATCSPGGANKWRREYAAPFAGTDVIILPDNDEPGQSHAAAVAKSLCGTAARVRVLAIPDLPEKGDIYDWLMAGGTAAALAELADQAPDAEAFQSQHSDRAASDHSNADLTEDGAALAFTEEYAAALRYCHHAQHWFIWAETHWRREESRLAFSWARNVCRQIAQQAEDKDRPKISKAAFAAAVERFAQSDRVFAVTADTWDCDPWVLGTPAGTIDLRTGKLRRAAREDYITKQTAVGPAPSGTSHPIWSEFLNQATSNDREFQAFLQRLVGYCLTGDVTEEILAFLYGEGGTGKGTLLGTVIAIMGDYAVTVPIEVFTAGTRLNLEYYRAQMAGARLVTASETEAGATWAESQIKEMTGNEAPLSGRHPYGKPFTFRPQFKIALVGNHAPRLKGASTAMQRRMRIAPFKHKPATPDHGLKERLRAEFPAILQWMIDGCLMWQRDRLGTCAAVAAETGSYFEQQDHFGRWLEERCVIDKTLASKPGVLQSDYNVWAKVNGEAQLGNNEFAELVDRKPGLARVKSHGVRLVKGIGLKAPEGSRQSDPGDDR